MGKAVRTRHCPDVKILRSRGRKRLEQEPGTIAVRLELPLRPDQLDRLQRFAAARFPKAPSGRLYLGKAAAVIYGFGEEWLREIFDGELRAETAEITEPEARAAGLRIIGRVSSVGRGARDRQGRRR